MAGMDEAHSKPPKESTPEGKVDRPAMRGDGS
jgi:hypothetical protein